MEDRTTLLVHAHIDLTASESKKLTEAYGQSQRAYDEASMKMAEALRARMEIVACEEIPFEDEPELVSTS